MSTIRVMSVDDHKFLVAGLQTRLEAEADIEFVGSLPTADHVVREAKDRRATIILLDLDMPGPDPFEALRDLTRQFPSVRVIIFSAHVRDHYIDQAYEGGAWGYLSKSDDPDEIVAGIRKVARGEIAMSPSVEARSQPLLRQRGERPKHGGSKLSCLTDRETQILRMIARGMGRTEIAESLCRSPMTVDNHRKSIMKKLEINDRGELVRFAIAEGLVEV